MDPMGISRVEYSKIVRHNEEGVMVAFTYDDIATDVFEVYGDGVDTVLGLISMEANPNMLLMTIRNLNCITIH